MNSPERKDSIEYLKSAKKGWPAAQGVRLGAEVKLPGHQGLLDGEVVGIEEDWQSHPPTVYATVEIKSQQNVRPEIEVGQLNEIQQDVKLMNFITAQFKESERPSEENFNIIISRLKDFFKRLNAGKQKQTGEKEYIVFQLKIVMDKSEHLLRLIKAENGYYTLEVDE